MKPVPVTVPVMELAVHAVASAASNNETAAAISSRFTSLFKTNKMKRLKNIPVEITVPLVLILLMFVRLIQVAVVTINWLYH